MWRSCWLITIKCQYNTKHLHINYYEVTTYDLLVPGGPKRRTPFGGPLSPVKMSGLSIGHTTISLIVFLANSSPDISSHPIVNPEQNGVEKFDKKQGVFV